jgi:tetratricopeptide (TPR) repeat protein
MARSPKHLPGILGFALLAVLLAACRGPIDTDKAPTDGGITLMEKKFFEIRQLELQLNEAMQEENADEREIRRLFQIVDLEYAGLISRNPDNIEIKILYGKLLSRVGDTQGAITQLGEVLLKDPSLPAVHLELSTCFADEGDYTRAMFYAFKAQELDPETAAYHYQIGQILAAFRIKFLEDEIYYPQQIDQLMMEAFSSAKDLQPDQLPLQFRYGEAFYDIDNPDWETAFAHWQSLLSHSALSATEADAVRLHMIKCLIELDQLDQIPPIANQIQTPAFRQSVNLLLPQIYPIQDN